MISLISRHEKTHEDLTCNQSTSEWMNKSMNQGMNESINELIRSANSFTSFKHSLKRNK